MKHHRWSAPRLVALAIRGSGTHALASPSAGGNAASPGASDIPPGRAIALAGAATGGRAIRTGVGHTQDGRVCKAERRRDASIVDVTVDATSGLVMSARTDGRDADGRITTRRRALPPARTAS